jgi:hypothetical protein
MSSTSDNIVISSDSDFNDDNFSTSSAYDKSENSLDSFIVYDDNKETLQSLFDKCEMNEDNEQSYLIHRIQTTIQNSNITLITPRMKFYSDAYGSCSLYPVDENTRLIPISYAFLYRY